MVAADAKVAGEDEAATSLYPAGRYVSMRQPMGVEGGLPQPESVCKTVTGKGFKACAMAIRSIGSRIES